MDIYEQLGALIEKGNEEEVRTFVREHFFEFPKDFQDKVVLSLMNEAMDEATASQEQMVGLKTLLLQALEVSDRAMQKVADEDRVAEIKRQLGAEDEGR